LELELHRIFKACVYHCYMNAKLNLTLSITAGFLGGMLLQFASPKLVHAQAPSSTVIGVAQTLQLPIFVVNESGAVVASFTMDADGQPNIKLFDAKPAARSKDGTINVPSEIWSARH
jgi:hypothetical protein